MSKSINLGIRADIRSAGLYQYQICDALSITEATFIRWMRKPLPDDKKTAVYNAIAQLIREREIT